MSGGKLVNIREFLRLDARNNLVLPNELRVYSSITGVTEDYCDSTNKMASTAFVKYWVAYMNNSTATQITNVTNQFNTTISNTYTQVTNDLNDLETTINQQIAALGKILQFPTLNDFPGTGDVQSLYIDQSTGFGYFYHGGQYKLLENLSYVPEDEANKSDDENLGISTTLYPTQRAVKIYVDNIIQESTLYDSALPSGSTVPFAVGGIGAGTVVDTLEGKTFSEMFDMLLFPPIAPTYVNPSYFMSLSQTGQSGLFIIGTSINQTLVGSYSAGAILQPWTGNSVQNTRAGVATSYQFSGFGITGTASQAGSNYPVTVTAVQGYMTWNSSMNYAQGPQPLNNFGNAIGSPLPAGSLTSTSRTIEGVYPLFATSVDVNTQTQQSVLYSMLNPSSPEIILASELGQAGVRQKFWVPTVWGRTLSSIRYFNTVSGSFDPENKVNDFIVTPGVMIGGISYTQYQYNGNERGVSRIQLNFT